MNKVEQPIAKKYANKTGSTLVVLGGGKEYGGKEYGGMRLYKGGVLKLNAEQVAKHQKELDRLVAEDYIEEVPMDTVSRETQYVAKPTYNDPLDQEDEPDKDNLFVKQKSPTIFNPNRPEKAVSDQDEGLDNIFGKPEAVPEDVVLIKTADEVKSIDPNLGLKKEPKTEQQILKEETIPSSDIDGQDKSLGIGDRRAEVSDGFEGAERTTTCVSNIQDWRVAVKTVNDIKSISELDKIIKYDPRPSVKNRAEQRKNSLLAQ